MTFTTPCVAVLDKWHDSISGALRNAFAQFPSSLSTATVDNFSTVSTERAVISQLSTTTVDNFSTVSTEQAVNVSAIHNDCGQLFHIIHRTSGDRGYPQRLWINCPQVLTMVDSHLWLSTEEVHNLSTSSQALQ